MRKRKHQLGLNQFRPQRLWSVRAAKCSSKEGKSNFQTLFHANNKELLWAVHHHFTFSKCKFRLIQWGTLSNYRKMTIMHVSLFNICTIWFHYWDMARSLVIFLSCQSQARDYTMILWIKWLSCVTSILHSWP